MDFDWHVFVYPICATTGPSQKTNPLFSVGFDEYYELLQGVDAMFIELDGAFVWREREGKWQIDGVVSERDERVAFLEVKGVGSIEPLKRMLMLLGWPQQKVILESPQKGITQTDDEFFESSG